MRSDTRTSKHVVSDRRGVSAVEFVGCLVALCGGVVLGSMYLGIDVQTLAVGVLDKADIAVPELLQSTDSSTAEVVVEETVNENTEESVTSDIADSSELTEQPAEVDQDELLATEEIAASEETESIEQPVSVERRELTEEEKVIATGVYWEGLSGALQVEARTRSQGIKDPSNWQLFDYLIHRKHCHEQAVETIENLDKFGIDSRLAAHADQVLSWQKTGVQLFDRATYLLTDAPAGKLTGPFAQSWQSAATQHRMEERLIQNKHAAVANYLEHMFKESDETPPAH